MTKKTRNNIPKGIVDKHTQELKKEYPIWMPFHEAQLWKELYKDSIWRSNTNDEKNTNEENFRKSEKE